jgi:hypothetical protein
MLIRQSAVLVFAVLAAGCTTMSGNGSGNSSFDIVDTNDDGQVDIQEFRQQNLFPSYEQFFYEASDDDNDTLGPDEFHLAESMVYNAMGVGGVDI